MSPERWSRIRDIFGEAIDLEESSRRGYVEQACSDDPGLRGDIFAMLERHEQAVAFVDRPVVGGGAMQAFIQNEQHPDRAFRIGERLNDRFRITAFLGEGGMGEVYAADDTELGAAVAIKALHPHLAEGGKVANRFRREIDRKSVV